MRSWIQISPLGKFSHSGGLQVVTEPVVETIVRNFRSFRGIIKRFVFGVPVYAGHPDVEGMEKNYPDKQAYGWLKELENRGQDGLWGLVEWNEAGRQLVADNRYKYVSPHWLVEPADGGVRPTVLISCGMTNNPNLPVEAFGAALANSQADATKLGEVGRLLESGQIEAWQVEAWLSGGLKAGNTASRLKTAATVRPKPSDALAAGNAAMIEAEVARLVATGKSYDEAWLCLRQDKPWMF